MKQTHEGAPGGLNTHTACSSKFISSMNLGIGEENNETEIDIENADFDFE
jgi:hypothetical protein